MDIGGYVKSHPIATGAIIIGGGFAFLLFSGVLSGGSSSSSSTSTGKSDTQVAADTQITLAQIQAAAGNNVLQSQLEQAQLSFQYSMAELAANKDLSTLQISSNQDLTTLGYQAQLEALKAQLNSSDTQAAISAGLTAHLTDASTGAAIQIAQIGASVQNTASNNALSATKNSNKTGVIKSVIGAGLALFSDVRLKRDVEKVGELSSGVGLYSYRYTWSDDWQLGVLAQEVARNVPGAVIQQSGFLAVRANANLGH